jgi:hypothetical protein
MILGFGIVTAVLASGTGQDPPNVRQASMPQAIVLYLAGSQLVITGTMHAMKWKTPIRLSSTPAGGVTPPGAYVLMEDIVSVDGGGKEAFRQALRERYDASHRFQDMVAQLNWFWGVGSLVVAGVVTVLTYTLEDLNVVFALGKWIHPGMVSMFVQSLINDQVGVCPGFGRLSVYLALYFGRRDLYERNTMNGHQVLVSLCESRQL